MALNGHNPLPPSHFHSFPIISNYPIIPSLPIWCTPFSLVTNPSALSLHAHSRKELLREEIYLREKLHFPLPSISILQRWGQIFCCSPGIIGAMDVLAIHGKSR